MCSGQRPDNAFVTVNQEPVIIAEYSSQWPAQFNEESQVLRATFGLIEIDIEHVGSTAVPGLAAKPIIDILLGANSLAQIESHIPHLESVGYRYVPEFEKQLPQRRYFVKPARGEARFHLHAVERGSAFWRDHLRFRDALRHQPALCDRYASLKRQLAASFFMDRAAYTDAKAPFIEAVLSELKRRA